MSNIHKPLDQLSSVSAGLKHFASSTNSTIRAAAIGSVLALSALTPSTVMAEEEANTGPLTFSANVTIASDYRFRGISQTENNFALQGGFDLSHESGFYIGTWASNLAGWGTFGGANTELDLYGGYATELNGFALDGGIIWYVFPAGLDNTSYGEFYASIGKSVGGLDLSIGTNYAFSQSALSQDGVNQDNIYVFGDAGFSLGELPISVAAHVGYSDGNSGQGPNGWVASPTGTFVDWSLGLTYALAGTPLEFGVTYVDTDIGEQEAADFALINPGYRFGIGAATAFFSVAASF